MSTLEGASASAGASTVAGASTLLELHRAGELAARYPLVAPLLAELGPDELARAGALLARVPVDEVRRHHPKLPVVKVAITGHGTLSPLVAPLTAELARHGLVLDPVVSPFDSYVFDLTDPGSALYAAGADLVLCVLDPMIVVDELPVPWTLADLEKIVDEKVRLLTGLADRFQATSRRTGRGTLVLNTLPLPRLLAGQLVDYRSRAALGALWRRAATALLGLADDRPSVVVLDLDPILADGTAARDPRLSVYAKAHLAPGLLAAYAREVGHLARLVAGQTRKCLVLDLDGTVWGGILGEDGPDGVEVADTYRGEAFRAFQKVARQIGSQGVLLAVVSKNDPDPVRRILAEHPGLTLRAEDFADVTANWRPKPENLRETARRLNLGTSSFVFVDDSPYERALVRRELPEIAVVDVDDEPASHVERLLADGWFNVREVTADDRARPARYREDVARGDFLDTFDSIEDYLRELGVAVRLEAARASQVGRLSQLTLRTNQFNLTTRRLQPPAVAALLDDPAALVLAIHSADRFGDNGLVGAILARRVRLDGPDAPDGPAGTDGPRRTDGTGGEVLRIENFLLSCRVFSRGIEHACLVALLHHARDTGVREVLGEYVPTAKNGIVGDLYPRYGFTAYPRYGFTAYPRYGFTAAPAVDAAPVAGAPGGAGGTTFRHDLRDIVAAPAHVALTTVFLGEHE
ncbi:HAD family hydrolase [Parafrankia sp. EUN1f]|uniref:HAD-IIIC family phosphatase n=1 Tax=Parafrankia sp. EUN1f TaxID=102897 RepID=UPI0001C463B7|nr:HAD-IIIC family phosphatase [Parafrankia sp. EUN1f]EFC81293.1 FkbH like protein [Parafrankia sp. EUN1f]